jgi:hypothetical protein
MFSFTETDKNYRISGQQLRNDGTMSDNVQPTIREGGHTARLQYEQSIAEQCSFIHCQPTNTNPNKSRIEPLIASSTASGVVSSQNSPNSIR